MVGKIANRIWHNFYLKFLCVNNSNGDPQLLRRTFFRVTLAVHGWDTQERNFETPRITRERAGRDHWNQTGITVMAGGGLRTGQVVGASDARGKQVNGRAITPQMMTATLYRTLGIDPARTFPNATGRPMYILDEGHPIPELF